MSKNNNNNFSTSTPPQEEFHNSLLYVLREIRDQLETIDETLEGLRIDIKSIPT